MPLIDTNKPLISILVNCYNSEEFLKQALDSIYQQTYQNFEIILVDNCSTDKTAAIAKTYDQRLKLVKTEKNIPLYGARNVGFKHIQGDYLCILDSDDYWVSTKLQKQIEIMNSYSQIDILYTAYNSHFEGETTVLNRFKRVYLSLINFSDNSFVSGFIKRQEIIKNYNINFQTIMFRTVSIKNYIFDDHLNLMGDLDFIYRLLWQKKCVLYYDSNLTAYSRIHQRQLSRKSDLRWVIESFKVLKKVKNNMDEKEISLFEKFYIRFYFSSHLLRIKKYKKALCLKFIYLFVSLRFFLHVVKSFFIAVKGYIYE